ncbi:MAG: mechanosensitive ion channel [Candidatus Nomurabacteria bacterium]|nr:MAG: mechanosensitive ion channel [Candidatus Nomurabacteria bacterium]
MSKILTLTHLFIASLFILRVWLPDSSALLAAYGFIAAAIAFSIQDVFKNAIGGVLILIRNLFSVGDRVQLGKDYGDVLDIGILYTRVLEIKNWVDGDQPTGRIVSVPNGIVISSATHNYTADHSFIWDEIHVPITYDSDWRKAESVMSEVVQEHTAHLSIQATKEMELLKNKYFLTSDSIEPNVYLKTTDNWISVYLRYIVSSRERREVNSRIHREILVRLKKERKVRIASATMSIDAKISK